MATAIRVQDVRQSQVGPTLLVVLIILYSLAMLLPLVGLRFPYQFIVGTQILAPALFALIHGSRVYGWRGMIVFTTICFVVCNIVENIGVVTGFPFGVYYFTDVMGPKVFRVPFTMGLAYLAIAYSCWTLTLVIVNRTQGKLNGRTALAVPVLAACTMLVWDVCSEPQWSTISHFWIWPHGGPYFGAPLSNFAGWLATDFIIFQLWAFYLVKRQRIIRFVPPTYWRLAWLSYIVVILANVMSAIAMFRLPPVYDPAGTSWKAGGIALNSISTSVFLMGAFALLACKRLFVKSPVYEKTQS